MLEEKTYKNYTELCKALGWKIKKRKDLKEKQLNTLKNFCKYEVNGNKFTITKIYSKEIIELGSGFFKEDIELLILNLLAAASKKNISEKNEYGATISLTLKNLLRALEMVNDNFVKYYKAEEHSYYDLSSKINVDNDIIADIFNIITNKNKDNLLSALKDLRNRALILFELRIKVCAIKEKEIINEKGEIEYQEFEVHRYTTNKEKSLILKLEKDTLDKLKIKNKNYLYFNKSLKRKFDEELKKQLYLNKIKYYYYTYDISYTENTIIKELNKYELLKVKNRLNKNTLDHITKTILNYHKKITDKYWGELPPDESYENKVRAKDNYVKDGKKTIKTLVDKRNNIK